MPTLPHAILSVLMPFAIIFQQSRIFQKAVTLFIGTLLCLGGVTVCAALRALGMNTDRAYGRFHRLLNRDRWNMLLASKILLNQLLDAFTANIITFAIDDTIERRRGKKIKAKGFFKDPLGTGANKIITCSGLRWVPIMLLVKMPFMKRTVALPFMVVLSPSEKTCRKINRRHKSPQRIAEQVCCLLRRWLPCRQLVLVTDAGYATRGLFRICQKLKIQLVTRARANGRFFSLPPQRTGKRGRPSIKGERLPSLQAMKNDPNRQWAMMETEGYGKKQRICWVSATECCWAPSEGGGVICVRLVFVKDSQDGDRAPVFCLITSAPELSLEVIVSTYTDRWSQEVTHRDVREYLGMETQRQWSDLSIARSTPLLFACYSLVFLITHHLCQDTSIEIAQAAWYQKEEPAFSDLMTSVRRTIREHQLNQIWGKHPILQNIPCPREFLRIFEEVGMAA
jgi:hypothetical protein